MDISFIYISIIILLLLIAFNLSLIIKALNLIYNPPSTKELPKVAEIGEKIPSVSATNLISQKTIDFSLLNTPSALIFLSSRCPKCQEKLELIAELICLVEKMQLNVILVSQEPNWRLKNFFNKHNLLQHVYKVNNKKYRKINPSLSSPAYIFLDINGALITEGMIDDENWNSFVVQIKDENY